MVQVGWFVVGDDTAKFGAYKVGDQFVTMADTGDYWKDRGYDKVPVYVDGVEADVFGVKE